MIYFAIQESKDIKFILKIKTPFRKSLKIDVIGKVTYIFINVQ